MNQILITQKIYVTPELKKKKKMYKFEFFISIFIICLLFSYYIYAEYDRNKGEKVSQEILANLDLHVVEDNVDAASKVKLEDDVLVVYLNNNISEEISLNSLIGDEPEVVEPVMHTTENGETYYISSVLNIPSLEINYPVLSETSDELLNISLNKFWGPEANEVGNYVIVGHNYKNKTFFGKLPSIEMGAIVELTDMKGITIQYEVYDKYLVDPTDVACTSQLTNGKRELTLITCNSTGKQRHVIKCREI